MLSVNIETRTLIAISQTVQGQRSTFSIHNDKNGTPTSSTAKKHQQTPPTQKKKKKKKLTFFPARLLRSLVSSSSLSLSEVSPSWSDIS